MLQRPVKVNCQHYEQFRGFIENAISDFVLIIEEVLMASTEVIKKDHMEGEEGVPPAGSVYVVARKNFVEMLFQERRKHYS